MAPESPRIRDDVACPAGFAAATQPVQAQTMIVTGAQGLAFGEVKIPAKDGEIPAYRAMPAGKTNLGIIIVVQEIWGVHEYIKDVCRRFATLGYLGIAPELYARYGDVSKMAVPDILANVASKVSDAQVNGDLDATATWAAGNGGDARKLGISGFCWGGRVVWMYAAHNPNLRAGVAWYGNVASARVAGDKSAIEAADRIRQPILALYGGADSSIPNETIEKMMATLKASGNTKSELVLYPNTPHAFHADYRPSYRKEAAEDGWKRCLVWFKQHGVA